MTPERLLDPERREGGLTVARAVAQRAREHLSRARDYTLLWPLPEGEPVRLFCAVPLALALATLRVEATYGRLARLAHAHPWSILGLCLALAIAAAIYTGRSLRIETSRLALLSPETPYNRLFLEHRGEFNSHAFARAWGAELGPCRSGSGAERAEGRLGLVRCEDLGRQRGELAAGEGRTHRRRAGGRTPAPHRPNDRGRWRGS